MKYPDTAVEYMQRGLKLCVGVVAVDVSDPAAPKVKNKLEITGNYLSSRVTDGKLLLMTQFAFGKSSVNFDDVRT